jgi:hypothetical protein
MRKKMTLPALMVMLLATPAAAEHMYVGTDLLYGWCKPYEVGDIGPGPLCAGYIYAVADIIASGESIHQRQACVPHDVSLDDLRNLVIGEMDKHPKGSPVSAHAWVAEVLSRAYPCVPATRQ